MRIIRNILEYLAASIIIILLLTTIGSVVIVKFYGDELRDNAMEIINDQLDTKISVNELGLSVFKNFPNTSIFFNQVTVWSGHNFNREEFNGISCDTLFYAERIYLEFNALDLLRKKYSLKGLEARNGNLKIFVDSSGNGNFSQVHREKENVSSDLIEINGVALKGFKILYQNKAKEIEARGELKNIFLNGQFASKSYLLKLGGNAYIEQITNQGILYFSEKELETDVALRVENDSFTIEKGEMMVGTLSAGIRGSFTLIRGEGAELDLHFIGKRISIEWISELLASQKISPQGFKGSGNINLAVNVTGMASSILSPHVDANFSTANAWLKIEPLSLELNSISLKGEFTNGANNSNATSGINLQSFSTRSGSSVLSGTFNMNNFLRPQFNLYLSGDLDAMDLSKQLSEHISEFPFEMNEGRIKPGLHIDGTLNNPARGTKNITLNPMGRIEIQNLSLLSRQNDIDFQSLSGVLNVNQEKIGAKIEGYFLDTDIKADLTLNNPLIQNAGSPFYQIEGSVASKNIDFDHLLSKLTKEKDGEKAQEYPKNIGVDIDFQFDQISKGEIITKKVLGTLVYKYPALYIDPVYLETMSGIINARISLLELDQKYHQLIVNSTFKNVNVSHLFKSFDNFGQDFLTYQNIAGSLSGKSEFHSTLGNDFSIETSKITSKNSFSIENGELNNFQPMLELSSFLKIDRMDQIKFSKISNTILIYDNLITIPEMDIHSSAINLQASGTHSFDKTFEYHLATKLSDILFSKAQSAHKQEFDIARDLEDQRTIFLVIYDKGEGMVVEFDEKQALQKIRRDLKEEKSELKVVLNEEFGLYKNDEAVIDQKKEKDDEPVMKFEFSEEQDKQESPNPDSVSGTKRKQRKKSTDKKKAEFEFVIDDSDL